MYREMAVRPVIPYNPNDTRIWGFGFRPWGWGFRPWGFGFGFGVPFFGGPFFGGFPFFGFPFWI